MQKYKALVIKTEQDSNKWKDIHYLNIKCISVINISIIPIEIYRFNPVKIPKLFFIHAEETILWTWNCKKTPK